MKIITTLHYWQKALPENWKTIQKDISIENNIMITAEINYTFLLSTLSLYHHSGIRQTPSGGK